MGLRRVHCNSGSLLPGRLQGPFLACGGALTRQRWTKVGNLWQSRRARSPFLRGALGLLQGFQGGPSRSRSRVVVPRLPLPWTRRDISLLQAGVHPRAFSALSLSSCFTTLSQSPYRRVWQVLNACFHAEWPGESRAGASGHPTLHLGALARVATVFAPSPLGKGGEGDSGQPLTISPQYWYRARTEVRWLSGLYEQELDHVFVRPHSIGVGASLKHIFCNGVRVRQFDKEH